jgi:methyl-accepting chemotaxis protein
VIGRLTMNWPWLRARAPEAPRVETRRIDEGLVLTELAQGKERVADRVEELKSLSESETLACGNVLSKIVDNVRELIVETDRSVAQAKARSDQTTASFVKEMQGDASAQASAVTGVLRLADGVDEAIRAINGLTQYSNLLAINARIEAARLGEQGRGFAVIAQHMRELSQTIRDSAGKVSTAIGAVREALPPVGERATSMQERTRRFVGALAEQSKAAALQADRGSAHSGQLDAVIELSNQALSHLQFQDPLVQNLSSINGELQRVESRVRRVLRGETQLEAVSTEDAAGGQPVPGKITLF